jgi:cytochrome c oxidase cbb3-type subunit 3
MLIKMDDTIKDSPEEAQILEGHSYDGIDELDNALPRWWINSFYLTILFAAAYFSYYTLGDGPTLLREHDHTMKAYEISQLIQKGSVSIASEDELKAFLKEAPRIDAGREIFKNRCLACHGAQGQGGIGPNLTDDYWIHGGKMTDILTVVTNGVLDKGMPPWGAILKQDELYSVVTFVKSLRGSNPAGAKAPQGTLVNE